MARFGHFGALVWGLNSLGGLRVYFNFEPNSKTGLQIFSVSHSFIASDFNESTLTSGFDSEDLAIALDFTPAAQVKRCLSMRLPLPHMNSAYNPTNTRYRYSLLLFQGSRLFGVMPTSVVQVLALHHCTDLVVT